ncbi:C45 family autoproteolytic acyltransferase/hydolase [Mariniphaga anaerophila]|nr:C45 family peptidase [Mariniphaga anaerophila]
MYTAFNAVLDPEWDEFSQAPKGTPRLEYHHSFPVIHLYGTAAEMGHQYGSILKKQLEGLDYITDKFFPENKQIEYINIAKNSEDKLPSETLEFVKGMSVSSGVDYYKLLAINAVPRVSCSVLAVWGDASEDGKLLMGRNADYQFKKINKALGIIVVKHPATGYATVASSFLGLAGAFTGINEKGVCYGNMLVYNGIENKEDENGLPIQLLMQTAAETQNSAREMIDYLTARKHVIPINVMCADKNEAIVAELGQTKFTLREGNKGVLAATNYFYSSGMFEKVENDGRLTALLLTARKYYGNFNMQHLQEAMHAARQPNKNLQCTLFEPERMLIHVSMNKVPASKGPFQTISVIELLEKDIE